MSEDHIAFAELNFDDPVDQSHLKRCEECGKKWAVFRFLGFQVKSAPRIDAPPFFTQRVAQLAQSITVSFAFLLQRAAQQLIPAFIALILATSFLLYKLTEPESAEYYSEILFEEPVQEDFTLEYVVNSLTEIPEEEPTVEESQ
ncbi:hypothetical protein MYX84_07375 [Acidobacteria bacterium AH-259-O06]|nr:hypothetical protein [Acidobacteria bacterium AH-259-O06]